jgi:ferredoxin-NADP reductase
MEYVVKILEIFPLTHDVKCIRIQKPPDFFFIPGQATELAVNTPLLKNERRPFTFTCLTDAPYLEFMIKRYPEHKGVTDAIHMLVPGDELSLNDVFGEILYSTPGLFIAGGAGITPFIAILRDLKSKGLLEGNRLLFGNRTSGDIILNDELAGMLGKNFINILSQERTADYHFGYIDQDFLKNIIEGDNHFYVCGPPPMMDKVVPALKNLGFAEDQITIEAM